MVKHMTMEILERAVSGKTGKIGLGVVNGIINAMLLEKSETAFLIKTVGTVALKALGVDAIPDTIADGDASCLGMKVYLWIKNLLAK